ncbi:MAG: Gfo/Idh/MocA family oxidoreductase [Planctomycetota bacterium]
MSRSNRRQFLKSSAAVAGASMVTVPALASRRLSANDRIRIGLVGLGGRMRAHVACLAAMEETDNIEIVAVADCDQSKRESLEKRYPQLAGKKLTVHRGVQELLEDESIDAISNAMGDRWHALSTIWACQAGKHVYVEKPGTHNLFEGRQMVAAARKYNTMVQHGTQNRSSPNIMEGVEKLKEGVVGDLYMARGLDYKIRGNLGTITPSPVPEGLDWDRWLGPKPMHPYSQFWHRRWHWNLELASGCFANQAVHELDVIRWGLGLDTHPTRVTAMGGKFVHDDDRTSPTHVAMTYRFDDAKPLVTYEHRSWYTNSEAGFRDKYPFVQPDFPVGTIFFGREGYLIFPDYNSYYTFLGRKGEPGPSKTSDYNWQTESIPHFRNWLAAIRANDHTVLNADIEEGHKSMAVCLLSRTSYQVGRCLNFDPDTESVLGDEEANQLLNHPDYREPYVVPKEV